MKTVSKDEHAWTRSVLVVEYNQPHVEATKVNAYITAAVEHELAKLGFKLLRVTSEEKMLGSTSERVRVDVLSEDWSEIQRKKQAEQRELEKAAAVAINPPVPIIAPPLIPPPNM